MNVTLIHDTPRARDYRTSIAFTHPERGTCLRPSTPITDYTRTYWQIVEPEHVTASGFVSPEHRIIFRQRKHAEAWLTIIQRVQEIPR